ncbi:MAG: hypothetical protein AAF127_04100 [Pseudomonadota bacterium]
MIAILTALAANASEPTRPECRYDREVELARDTVAFDQIEGQGWRPLYAAKCYLEAAKLLRDWQAQNPHALDLADPRERSLARILVWHEAQMWAFADRTDRALPIFKTTYREGDGISITAWNLYVDGTLAFLHRDKDALKSSIAELAAVPKPPGWDNAVDQTGKPVSLPWPQNLDVLEGLSRCWQQSYRVAYLCRDTKRGG